MTRPSPFNYYRVYGLDLRSDRTIHGLRPQPAHNDVQVEVSSAPPPVEVALEEVDRPSYSSPFRTPHGRPVARAWRLGRDGEFTRFEMSDGASFTVDRHGARIWVESAAVGDDEVSGYLLGPILGLALRRRGILCLHASVVALDGRAVAFAGCEGAGKSTIAALCAMRGATLVADDLAAVEEIAGAFWVRPGAPYLRMRPGPIEAIAADLGQESDLQVSPDGQYLDLVARPDQPPAPRGFELAAVYFLDLAASEPVTGGRMTGADALMAIVGDTWATRLIDRHERASEFDVAARLVEGVPLWRVAGPTSAAGFAALADRVMDGVRRV